MRSALPVSIDPWRFGTWLLFLVVVGLGGRYLGGGLQILRLGLWFAPGISILWLAVTAAYLRYSQEFSNDHPAKGSRVDYVLSIKNESVLPACRVTVTLVLGAALQGFYEVDVFPRAGASVRLERTLLCEIRGVYELGLADLCVTDPLGLISVRLAVWHRTFYVAPRILEPRSDFARPVRDMPGAEREGGAGQEDVSLFRELVEYREGMDVRRLAHAHSAARGFPLLRTFDSAVEERLRIVLDTRPAGRSGEASDGRVEDVSIETAVSLAVGCVRDRVPARIEGGGVDPVELESVETLEAFVKRSVGVFFRAGLGPLEYARAVEPGAETPIVCVTHEPDSTLIEELSADVQQVPLGAVFNTSGMTARERGQIERLAVEARSRGRFCLALSSADELTHEGKV